MREELPYYVDDCKIKLDHNILYIINADDYEKLKTKSSFFNDFSDKGVVEVEDGEFMFFSDDPNAEDGGDSDGYGVEYKFNEHFTKIETITGYTSKGLKTKLVDLNLFE